MNISIKTTIGFLLVVVTSLLLPALAQQPNAQQSPAQQPDMTPVPLTELPLYGSLTHTRNVRIGSTPASRAAEAAAAQAKGQRSQADIANGEDLMKAGNQNEAIAVFQHILSYDPDYGLAYQRLAEAQTAAGKLSDAADSYRMVLYRQPGKNWSDVQNGNPVIHMQFALLLQRLGLREEALTVYQHGYQLLQMEEDPSNTTSSGPLPTMLASPDFTAAQMEAAADTVIAVHKYDWEGQASASADFQHVLSLQPDAALPYFYLGQIYKFQSQHAADAVAAFRKAAQLGGPAMTPFLEKAQKAGGYEFMQAVKQPTEPTAATNQSAR